MHQEAHWNLRKESSPHNRLPLLTYYVHIYWRSVFIQFGNERSTSLTGRQKSWTKKLSNFSYLHVVLDLSCLLYPESEFSLLPYSSPWKLAVITTPRLETFVCIASSGNLTRSISNKELRSRIRQILMDYKLHITKRQLRHCLLHCTKESTFSGWSMRELSQTSSWGSWNSFQRADWLVLLFSSKTAGIRMNSMLD